MHQVCCLLSRSSQKFCLATTLAMSGTFHVDAGVQFDDALPERLLEEYQFNVAEKQVLTDYAIDHRIMADHEAEQTPRFGPDRFL